MSCWREVGPNEPILEEVCGIRRQVDIVNERTLALMRGVGRVEVQVANLSVCVDRMDARLDRIAAHLDRVERRLGLIEA